jgi:hypothetical protein
VSTLPKDPRFFELFCRVIETGLRYVRLAESGKTYIGKHDNWPELQWRDNGLPFIFNRSDGPQNYGDVIRGLYSALYGLFSGEAPPDFSKEPTFLALVKYAKTNPRLKKYLSFDRERNLGTSRLLSSVASVLDRYVHIYGLTGLEPTKLLPVYSPIETYLFDDPLPITVVVPILFLKFELQKFNVDEFISVERLTDEIQLARAWRPFGSSDRLSVGDAATHGLFITNCSVANGSWWDEQQVMRPESYPVEKINTFFAALRISTGYPTGYAQMLSLPLEWASMYAANLTPIDGASVENYPPVFEHRDWNEEVPSISSGEADAIRDSFENLQRTLATKYGGKVRLAMHRLNLGSLRTTDEDGVIDSMIAMEALLSDGTQEMTYKIAMRLAALYKILDPSRPEQVFRELKDVYSFRSKIVHGDAILDKYREIDRHEGRTPAIDIAVEHLRNALAVLIKHPTLLDPKKIDGFLLTGNY